MDYDISDVISALKLNNGDINLAAEYLAGTKRKESERSHSGKTPSNSDDESDQPAEKRQRVESYNPKIKKFLEERFNLPSNEAERESIRIHKTYSEREEDIPIAAPPDDLRNLNVWKGRNSVQFKAFQPYQSMPNVVQHLPHAPYYGLLLSQNDSISPERCDTLFELVLNQYRLDQKRSENWKNKLIERYDLDGNPEILFKGDVRVGHYAKDDRVIPATRSTLNIGMDYVYLGVPNRGIPFSYDSELVRYVNLFRYDVAEFIKKTWPYINQPFPGLPNNVLINYYPDGDQSNIGAHSDKVNVHQNQLTSPVAMISFGAGRKWQVTPSKGNPKNNGRIYFDAGNGQMAVMYEPMQQYWSHAVPKRSDFTKEDPMKYSLVTPYQDTRGRIVRGRISLTFRWLKSVQKINPSGIPGDESGETADERAARFRRMAKLKNP